MGNKVEAGNIHLKQYLLKVPILSFGRVTVALPAFSLLYCFITAILYSYDEVNKTVCNVENYMPSISAVTGISPQRYVWRTCIGLHSMARFVIGFILINYYFQRQKFIKPSQHSVFRTLAKISLLVYTVENSCLLLVANIGNTENYPLHEKIFVVFMFSSLIHEFLNIIIFKWTHPDMKQNAKLSLSYRLKMVCYWLNLLMTVCLLFFFLRHRWYCEPGAFTWFSAVEYGIAYLNIGYHYTATFELEGFEWYFGKVVSTDNGHFHGNNNNNSLKGNGHKKQL